MPRPRFSDWIITPTPITLNGGSSLTLYIDMVDTFYPQVFYMATWATTASSSGLAVTVYSGYAIGPAGDYIGTSAGNSPNGVLPPQYSTPPTNIAYVTVGTSINVDSQPIASTGTPQTVNNDFALDEEVYPRRVKLVITNLDAGPCTLFVSGDR